MTDRGVVDVDQVNTKTGVPLVARMDPAIGEATTLISAMVTELLRRSLRGGVIKIGEELEGLVAEQLDATIQDKKPVLEQIASEVAEKYARVAATEVAVGEVRALEERTREADQDLAGQIGQAARTSQMETASTARELAARIEEAAKQSDQAREATAQQLGGQIAETEKRLGGAVRAEMNGHVQDILERARKGSVALNVRLQKLEQYAVDLGKQEASLRQQLAQAAAEQQAAQDKLRQDLDQLLDINEALCTRVAELEKPRGLRALWAWLRGARQREQPIAEE